MTQVFSPFLITWKAKSFPPATPVSPESARVVHALAGVHVRTRDETVLK